MSLSYYKLAVILDKDAGGQNGAPNQAVAIYKADGVTLATIYSDAAGTSPIAQPGAVTDAEGSFEFYASFGEYIVKSGAYEDRIYVGIDDRIDLAVSDAEAAQAAAELARDQAQSAQSIYADVASGEAATVDGDYFWVVSADDSEVLELWLMGVSTATDTGKRTPSTALIDYILSTQGKNLIDKNKFRRGFRVSPVNGGVISDANWICTDHIKVEEGETYTLSGTLQNPTFTSVFYFSGSGDSDYVSNAAAASTVNIPAGITHVVINVTNEGSGVTTYDDTAQFEVGSESTPYEPYTRKIPQSLISGLAEALNLKTTKSEIIEQVSFNMIDPSKVDFVNRYSEPSLGFTTDTLGIAASDWIPVEEGELYTLSGDGVYNPTNIQGGYFTAYGEQTAVANISDFAPVTGDGRVIQVPEGVGITHVVVSLRKLGDNPAATELAGDVQLEKGEVATAYEPFDPQDKIIKSLIPDDIGGSGSVTFNSELWYKYTEGGEGNYQMDKLPNFREHWLKRDKDLCVVNTGTSLTARSDEHCTDHPFKEFRPPLMHSNNMASILWDKMKWDNQEYRRYDSGYFTESGGTFATSSNLAEWDDGPYRRGLTRYSEDTGASVAFQIPVDAWQFNFIYRTDSLATEQAQVTITEGNGLVEVFNEDTQAWVEANGFSFTMREPAPVTRSIDVPDPDTQTISTVTIASKGNTTYQKRLKMRCKSVAIDSRASVKNVTVAGVTAGRFLYWGVEWSKRQYMITYINAARGSHNTNALSTNGLPKFQDNEIWSFKPDLLFFELPIHNDGAAAASSNAAGVFERLTENFVFRTDYELSLKTRGQFFGLAPEIGMFNSSIAYNFGGIDEAGNLIIGEQSDGAMMTALDKYNQAYNYVVANYPEAVFINSVKRWVDAGYAIFGDLKSATVGSGKAGATFTNEGSHWNDTGSKIIAKTLTPVFDFTSQ